MFVDSTFHWHEIVRRNHPPLFVDLLCSGQSYAGLTNALGSNSCPGFSVVRKRGKRLVILKEDYDSCVKHFLSLEYRQPHSIIHFFQRCVETVYSIEKRIEELVDTISEQRLDRRQLARAVDQYAEIQRQLASYLITHKAAEGSIELIRGNQCVGAHRYAVLQKRYAKWRPTNDDRAKAETLSSEASHAFDALVQVDGTSNTTDDTSRYRNWCQKFGWLDSDYFVGGPIDPVTLAARVQAERTRRDALGKDSLEPRLLLPDTGQPYEGLVYYGQLVGQRRLESFFFCYHRMHEIWHRCARLAGVDQGELPWLFAREIKQGVLNSISSAELGKRISARRAGLDYEWTERDGLKTTANTDWDPTMSLHATQNDAVSGSAGNHGHGRGIVRLVDRIEDTRQVGPGTIVVAESMTPVLSSNLHQIAGLIVEEGGALSHAALLAREQQIPCLLDAHDATLTFDNGDLVELTVENTPTATRVEWKKGVRRWAPVLWRNFSTLGHATRYMQSALEVSKGLDTCKNVLHQTFLATDEYSALENAIRINANDPAYLDRVFARCYRAGEKLTDYTQSIRSVDLSGEDRNSLARRFNTYADLTLHTVPFRYGLTVIDALVTQQLEAGLVADLEQPIQQIRAFLPSLIEPPQHTFEQAFDYKLDGLSAIVQRALAPGVADNPRNRRSIRDNFKADIDAILTEYSWLKTSYFVGEPLSMEDIVDELIKKLDQKPSAINEVKQTRPSIEELSVETQNWLRLAGIVAHLRSYRISVCYRADFLVRPLLEMISRHLDIPYSQLIQMTSAEIQMSLDQGRMAVTRDDIVAREHMFGFFLCGGHHWLETGAHLLTRSRRLAEAPEVTSTISGMTVYEGVVRGSVCIVRGRHDLFKLHPGSVIVAPMTTNDWTFAIKKYAVAIITDEGGVTSHAAIISRELGIPCVVGLGTATDVFRDEDIVDVRALGAEGTITRIA
jgi:phosphohistidine swiveling domain-containing protein